MVKESKFGLNIFFLLFVVVVFFVGYKIGKSSNKESYNEIYKTQIDSLQNKIDSLYNVEKEVDLQIDTITIELEKTKIVYEKERNTILNNTPSEDFGFFTNYINSNRERLYSDFDRAVENN